MTKDAKVILNDKFIKEFHFSDETDLLDLSCSSSDSLCSANELHVCDKNCVNIKITEKIHSNFGIHVWPSAPVLGKYIWVNRSKLKGKNILELGTGTGLVSIVASKCGASVTITDSYDSVLDTAKENLLLNDCKNIKVRKLKWGCFPPWIIAMKPVDIILGSDIFYNPKDFEDIIVTVSYILKKNINAEFWCTYEKRCSDWNIEYLMEKFDLICEEISLDSFNADSNNVAGCDLPGLKEIHLFVFHAALNVNNTV